MWRLSGNGNTGDGHRTKVGFFNQLGQFVLGDTAYQKRFDIEELRGIARVVATIWGYQVSALIVLILLITIAHSTATMQGRTIKRMGVQKYVGRVKESDGYSDGTAVLHRHTVKPVNFGWLLKLSLWSS